MRDHLDQYLLGLVLRILIVAQHPHCQSVDFPLNALHDMLQGLFAPVFGLPDMIFQVGCHILPFVCGFFLFRRKRIAKCDTKNRELKRRLEIILLEFLVLRSVKKIDSLCFALRFFAVVPLI
jgi:hypothetical protein